MPTALEPRVRAIGREVFARLDRLGPPALTPAWFDDQLMGWSMSDEAVKVQLFRFVDALPLLHGPADIARHLREYFAEAGDRVPGWLRFGLRLMPETGPGGRLLAWSARWNAERLARKFIAGSDVAEATAAVMKLRRQNAAFTIDLLGEATITEAEADAVRDQYLELITGLCDRVNRDDEVPLIDRDEAGPVPRVNVSVKLSALYSQFDPIDPDGTFRAVAARLRPILRLARQRGAFVNFDMEQYAFKDVTLQIFRDILTEPEFADWPHVGIAIQAYLRDTSADLIVLRDWAMRRRVPVWVRLVKGAYWDFETMLAAREGWPVPVYTRKWQSDASYERLSRFLLKNHAWLRPAFGSHNIRSLAHALAVARELQVPRGRYEFQMLYGMADPIRDAFVSLGQRVRVYTPYGKLLPGMAYLVRRLLENTSNDSFLRASFREHLDEDLLLVNPNDHAVGDMPTTLAPPNHSNRGTIDMPAQTNGSVHTAKGQPGPVAGSLAPFRNEPLSDFARESNREAMRIALAEVAPRLGQTYPLVIAGRDVSPAETIEVRNPSRISQLVGRAGKASVEQAKQAIAAATTAFDGWLNTPVEERAAVLFRAASIMRRRRFELAAWEVFECGKPWREADADVAEAIDFCEYYGREMLRLSTPHRRDVPGEDNELFYEPRGVAVVIAPWNFPLAILCGMTAAALVTGNTVVMKPAEQSPVIAAHLMDIWTEAGLPIGVANYLPGNGEEIGPTLVNHPDTAIVAFTGSLPVGLTINEQAAKTPAGQDHIKRVIAELGGKNAIIVDADADLDEAVKGVLDSAFGYSGQKCSACSRAVVLEPIHDQFLPRLVEAARSLSVAPADQPGCGVGPVISEESRDRIRRYIDTGKAEAKLAFAGDVGSLENEGWFVAPHIFSHVDPKAVIAQEEIFGPVLAVIKARDLDHALEIANGTRFALTGGLYTRSPEAIRIVRRRFRVGNLYINRKITGALVDRHPFGGFKLSGIGSKAGGPDYLMQFLLPRTITENTMRRGFAPMTELPVE